MTEQQEHRGPEHSHCHRPPSHNAAFAIGITLNLGFVIVEAVYGLAANSCALLSDAGHNLSDVLGLLIAWGAIQVFSDETPHLRFAPLFDLSRPHQCHRFANRRRRDYCGGDRAFFSP